MTPNFHDIIMTNIDHTIAEYALGKNFDKEKYKKLEEACDIMQEILDEFGAISVDVDPDAAENSVIIGFECDEIVVEDGRSHPFFKLVALFDAIRFMKSEDEPDMLRTELIMQPVWREA